ncbi:hypothetical protein GDO81_029668 [Engystomops pustulosus]|uniref:Uncharacterized protein n=1 Tax=Engystomops pustulosus TaxID=76066 RepID=A0AAV6YDB9_ENGPU|nr:hypothetical protein GDO81_029668 [Engystomops pustulosus]
MRSEAGAAHPEHRTRSSCAVMPEQHIPNTTPAAHAQRSRSSTSRTPHPQLICKLKPHTTICLTQTSPLTADNITLNISF